MRTWNDLHADDLADLSRRSRPRVGRGFHCGHVAAEKRGYVSAADFFLAVKRNVRGFEGGVRRFKQGAQNLAFDHSNRLL